jgi:hypothetical protein
MLELASFAEGDWWWSAVAGAGAESWRIITWSAWNEGLVAQLCNETTAITTIA